MLNCSPIKFIHLRKLTLGEYNFVFHINDGYGINDLSKFGSKHQFLFVRLNNKNQQMNLMLVDSIFPILLADIVLEVFLNKGKTLKDCMKNAKIDLGLSIPVDERYLKYKFKVFLELSLYSTISSKDVCKGDIDTSRVFCLRDSKGERQYYSIYEWFLLFDHLVEAMQLKIDFKKSSIQGSEVTLCLKMIY